MTWRLLALLLLLLALPVQAARVKDIARLDGVRDNHLVGYGVVVGLKGTGDLDFRGVAPQSVSALLARLGVTIPARDLRLRNVAAVLVTATLPAFVRPGDRIDVSVSSLGDARSLAGGTLIATPLTAADGRPYAVAQGALVVGGFDAAAGMNQVYRNYATSGRIASGATVERPAPARILHDGSLRLVLHRADFTTAQRLASSVTEALRSAGIVPSPRAAPAVDGGATASTVDLGEDASTPPLAPCRAEDGASVVLDVPAAWQGREVELLSLIENAWVDVDQRSVVVVSERTGTVVVGAQVRIAPVAVAHGGLEIEIRSSPEVSQPSAFGQGTTAVTRQDQVQAHEQMDQLRALGVEARGASVADLATALNALGATPRDLVVILEALRSAGALQAELVVQ
ncbi:MAG: flagellar basal body P-ring protein FlgI [Pseudomonadota bacterium]